MKAMFSALFLGCLWAPNYATAADQNQPPAADGITGVEITPPAETDNHSVAVAGTVTRAAFTSEVKNLEPVDSVSTLTNDHTRISYFTEIHGMAGKTVRHRWEYQDKLFLEIPFKVGSSHWRIYSSKTLNPASLGEWKASVVDTVGSSLCVNTFTYIKKPDAQPTPALAAPKTAP